LLHESKLALAGLKVLFLLFLLAEGYVAVHIIELFPEKLLTFEKALLTGMPLLGMLLAELVDVLIVLELHEFLGFEYVLKLADKLFDLLVEGVFNNLLAFLLTHAVPDVFSD